MAQAVCFHCSALPLSQRPTWWMRVRYSQSDLGSLSSGRRLRPSFSICAITLSVSLAPAMAARVG